ncbi:uncharacterized protein PHACADRAFT_182807 [Phanerochaete carnosa HHB-10118-sp]|uniref:DUF6533 domain-containing protein n=1 Tax=Phanerochaete carnosa (strain HHB-10118-sp) TaxID=650164 RepID=K5V6X8_PHACS|nr:uncharacterized protein PHACADRAFT_182807 [Phanerochaete carnosa HHB-10118-sp]EKM58486.1 hypothetical protein PHACADRAFT_182807 [Phanerochaete carnosa HHB-10118-sp]
MRLTFRRELTRRFPCFRLRHVRILCSASTNARDAGGHRCRVLPSLEQPRFSRLLGRMFQTSSKTVLTDPGTFANDAAVQNYVCVAMMTLILWEHVITLPEEIHFIWRRRLSRSTVLFIINRYGVLLYGALAIATEFADGQALMHEHSHNTPAANTDHLLVCSALRASALWNKNLQLFLAVLTLNLIPFGVNIIGGDTDLLRFQALIHFYDTYDNQDHDDSIMSLIYASDRSSANTATFSKFFVQELRSGKVIATARASTILADFIVLYATLIKTFETQRVANSVPMQVPLTTMLIRDGTIYFLYVFLSYIATVLSMNIAQLIVFHTTGQVYLVSFICTVTAILVSRSFLDLGEIATGGLKYDIFGLGDAYRDLEELVLDTPIITECGSTSDSLGASLIDLSSEPPSKWDLLDRYN